MIGVCYRYIAYLVRPSPLSSPTFAHLTIRPPVLRILFPPQPPLLPTNAPPPPFHTNTPPQSAPLSHSNPSSNTRISSDRIPVNGSSHTPDTSSHWFICGRDRRNKRRRCWMLSCLVHHLVRRSSIQLCSCDCSGKDGKNAGSSKESVCFPGMHLFLAMWLFSSLTRFLPGSFISKVR